jgi:hypothetical protein
MNPNFLSTKFIFAVLLTVALTVFVLTDKATVDQWIELAKWIYPTLAIANVADKMFLKPEKKQ